MHEKRDDSFIDFAFGVFSFFLSGWLALVFLAWEICKDKEKREDVLYDVFEFFAGYWVGYMTGLSFGL
jgi:hypothetical protein